jgi:iron-sulfur cluster assembly protein
MIAVTDNAVKHLRELLESQNADAGVGLRLMVKKGGCAGMEYAMTLDAPKADDQIFGPEGVAVIVDPESFDFLKGCRLDYSEGLSDEGFKVENPNAVRSCGCGSSFEPKGV